MNRYSFDAEKHLHSLDGKPLIGTTTAISILDKQLAYWASGLAVSEFGWSPINDKDTKGKVDRSYRLTVASKRFAEIKKLSDSSYLELLDKGYRAHAASRDKSRDKGIDLHLLLSNFIKNKMAGKLGIIAPEIDAFVEWSNKNVQKFLFSEMHCYDEALFCGGISDFGFLDMEGKFVLGDFKSSAEPYYSHWLQCGAYDYQIGKSGGYIANGEKIFNARNAGKYAIFCERAGLSKPFFTENVESLKTAFVYAISLYKQKMWFERGN